MKVGTGGSATGGAPRDRRRPHVHGMVRAVRGGLRAHRGRVTSDRDAFVHSPLAATAVGVLSLTGDEAWHYLAPSPACSRPRDAALRLPAELLVLFAGLSQ